MLVDSVEVELRAGDGGDGIISWRREKFVPRGGPDGGDGGRGGSVVLRASHNLDTLSAFRFRKTFAAERGENGMGKKKSGESGADLELLVPVGTRVIELNTNRVVTDLVNPDQTFKVALGGKGGLGNVHFKSSTNQNPFESTKGQPGEKIDVKLELQFVADVALIGEPNAGKSSIIAALTGAAARIGAYPFSTTEPVLGVLKKSSQTVVLIDLPGLIAGAHRGKGLGTQFLRHTSRVKLLVLVVEATAAIEQSQEAVMAELRQYDAALIRKPLLLVLNKSDLLNKEEAAKLAKKFPDAILISAKEGLNLDQLTKEIIDSVS